MVSLGAYTIDGQPSITEIAWTRGLAVVVGVVSAVVVNWILWPFIARHELRKAISAMLIYSSIIYRGERSTNMRRAQVTDNVVKFRGSSKVCIL